MLSSLIAAVTGPRGRWVSIGVWLVAAIGGVFLHSRLGEVTAAGQSSYLPADSESTRAINQLASFGSGEDVPALIVFARASGLTARDRAAIERITRRIDADKLAGATRAFDPLAQQEARQLLDQTGLVARGNRAAVVALGIDAEVRNAVTGDVERIRALLGAEAPPGLAAHLTGPAGIATDFEQVADEAGRTLLFATLGLVLILLLVVYRSPALAVLPLLVVGAAYMLSAGLAYFLIKADLIEVNTEGTMLLLVLIFGAGTDYSLLMVHRYRSELASGGSTGDALRRAVSASGPAILASGGTVMAALLMLLVADLESTRWLGPVLALGVAVMLLASFTLLPAALALFGDRAFWPGRRPTDTAPSKRWLRVASLVERRSRLLIVVSVAVLAVAALGNLINTGTIGFGQGETKPTDSSRGTEILEANFPAGVSSPVTVVADSRAAVSVARRLQGVEGVELAAPAEESRDKRRTLVAAILKDDPYSPAALESVARMRTALAPVDPTALVGGITAENLDIEDTNSRDTTIVVPAILVVVFVILVILLRALVAPGYLILTVVLSFGATLGLATVLFTQVLGQEGLSFNLTLLSFMFLVALGVDYSIFLMHRARREAAGHGTRSGMLRALVDTGGVVTGAGIVLAGTFATLTILPLEALVQIGGTVALGVLLDTFLVRALLVPAITYRLGDRVWWPGHVGSGDGRRRRGQPG